MDNIREYLEGKKELYSLFESVRLKSETVSGNTTQSVLDAVKGSIERSFDITIDEFTFVEANGERILEDGLLRRNEPIPAEFIGVKWEVTPVVVKQKPEVRGKKVHGVTFVLESEVDDMLGDMLMIENLELREIAVSTLRDLE